MQRDQGAGWGALSGLEAWSGQPQQQPAEQQSLQQLDGWTWYDDPLSAGLGLPPLPPPPPGGGSVVVEPALLPAELLLAQPVQQQSVQQQQQQQQRQQAAQPGSATGGGQVGEPLSAAEEARRARNRATQQRFREKQKAKNKALLEDHASTAAALERTRLEHEQLAARSGVLHSMLAAKDAQVGVLEPLGGGGRPQQAQQAAPAAAPPPALLKPQLPRRPSEGELPMSDAVKEQLQALAAGGLSHLAQMDLPATAHPDETMAVAFEYLTSPAAVQPSLMPRSEGAADSGDSGGAATGPPSTAQPQSSSESGGDGRRRHSLAALAEGRPDLVERVLQMSPEELVADWRARAQAFGEVLEAYDATHNEAQLERVLDIFRQFSAQMSLTLHYKPENARALFSTAALAPPGHWERVAGCLAPTQAQRTMLRQSWHAFAGQVHAIRAERTAAMQAAHLAAAGAVTLETLPASTLGLLVAGVPRRLRRACLHVHTRACLCSLPAARGLMSGYLSLFEAAGRLSTLQDAEFVAMLQLLQRMGAVFSPVQKARVAAVSHPYFPDSVQLVRLLAEDGDGGGQGRQQQQQQQQQQAASSTALARAV